VREKKNISNEGRKKIYELAWEKIEGDRKMRGG
jgi:hypothetical protein